MAGRRGPTAAEARRATAHLTDKQVFDLAREHGHTVSVAPTESGARWLMRCSCQASIPANVSLPTRATRDEVYRQVITHCRSAVAQQQPDRVNGGVSPRKAAPAV